MKPFLPFGVLAVTLALGTAAAQTPPAPAPAAPTAAPRPPALPAATVTLTDVPAGHWARQALELLARRGLLVGYPDGTFQGDQSLTRYEAAALFAQLLQGGALSRADISPEDLRAVARGLEEVTKDLVQAATRVARLESDGQRADARIAALEDGLRAVTVLATAPPVAPASLAAAPDPAAENERALTAARLEALEQAVRALPVMVSALTPAEAVRRLEGRVADLERARTAPAPIVVAPTRPARLTYVAVATGAPLGGTLYPNVDVSVGRRDLLGPVGLNAGVAYRPSARATSVEGLATAVFASGELEPYVGLGGGASFSPARADAARTATDPYAAGVVGANLPMGEAMSFFGEAALRYFFSAQGYGPALGPNASGGVSASARLGLKFRF